MLISKTYFEDSKFFSNLFQKGTRNSRDTNKKKVARNRRATCQNSGGQRNVPSGERPVRDYVRKYKRWRKLMGLFPSFFSPSGRAPRRRAGYQEALGQAGGADRLNFSNDFRCYREDKVYQTVLLFFRKVGDSKGVEVFFGSPV